MIQLNKEKRIVSWGILLLFCLFCYRSAFSRQEHIINDYFLKSGANYTDDIVIIAIDDESIERLGRYPWTRSVHGRLIETVSKGNPAAIGLDLLFLEESDDDDYLSQAIEESGVVVLAAYANLSSEDTHVKINGPLISYILEPIDAFAAKAVTTGHINGLVSEEDSTMRRHIPYVQDIITQEVKASLSTQLYWLYLERITQGGKQPSQLPGDYQKRPYIHYIGPPGSVSYVSYADAMDEEIIDPEYFRDKILLVGLFATGTTEDTYYTPADGVEPMYGVEIHANIINNLIFEESIYPTSKIMNTLLCFIAGAIAVILVGKRERLEHKFGIIFATSVLYSMAYVMAFRMHYMIQVVYPVLFFIALFFVDFIITYVEEYAERQRITKAFGRYVATQVLDKIIEEGESSLSLGGAKKDVTIMFVDIRGFTKMSEYLAPETVVAILNEYLSLATEAIFNNRGTLDKYIGDAVMALYNVPYEVEDHAFLAVKTAIEMKEMSEKLYERLIETYGYGVHFGIGINTGVAVVGNIGSEIRLDYTAIGDTVNVASRLESNAKPGQILISKEVYEKVKDKVAVEHVGKLSVKNRETEIDTYEVLHLL